MPTQQAESGFDIARLKELRTRAGLTQMALGAKAGVSHITICQYECGKVPRPRASVLARIEAALSACPEVGGGFDMTPYPDGLHRTSCPHCGAPNCHTLERPIPGIEFQCISCTRVFRLDKHGRAYIPEPRPPVLGQTHLMSPESRANISAGQRRRHQRERAEE